MQATVSVLPHLEGLPPHYDKMKKIDSGQFVMIEQEGAEVLGRYGQAVPHVARRASHSPR